MPINETKVDKYGFFNDFDKGIAKPSNQTVTAVTQQINSVNTQLKNTTKAPPATLDKLAQSASTVMQKDISAGMPLMFLVLLVMLKAAEGWGKFVQDYQESMQRTVARMKATEVTAGLINKMQASSNLKATKDQYDLIAVINGDPNAFKDADPKVLNSMVEKIKAGTPLDANEDAMLTAACSKLPAGSLIPLKSTYDPATLDAGIAKDDAVIHEFMTNRFDKTKYPTLQSQIDLQNQFVAAQKDRADLTEKKANNPVYYSGTEDFMIASGKWQDNLKQNIPELQQLHSSEQLKLKEAMGKYNTIFTLANSEIKSFSSMLQQMAGNIR